MRIATLNIRGRGSDTTRQKWTEMNQLVRNNKIDILAIQETHLSDVAWEELNTLFKKQIYIVSSLDTTQPNAKRVAFILNKSTIRWKEAKTTTIVEGQAQLLEILWAENKTLRCVNIYAPNNPQQNENFWKKLKAHWSGQRGRSRPQIVLNDMNIVKDALDRL